MDHYYGIMYMYDASHTQHTTHHTHARTHARTHTHTCTSTTTRPPTNHPHARTHAHTHTHVHLQQPVHLQTTHTHTYTYITYKHTGRKLSAVVGPWFTGKGLLPSKVNTLHYSVQQINSGSATNDVFDKCEWLECVVNKGMWPGIGCGQ